MNRKGSASMKMKKGFMCQSTAVCISHDYRPVNYVHLGGGGGGQLGRRSYQIPPPSFKYHQHGNKPAASLSHHHHHLFQVVVMRVSIHCQGCAGKVKKHLSKMEGVTSFSIDLESKRVTVAGHVSPSGVLESISKVKKAEFWPC